MDYKAIAKDARVMAESFRQDGNVYLPNRLDMHATAITDLIARAEAADARCKTLEKMVREYQDVIVPGYREWAEKAEMERDEAVESICMRCSVLPCRKNECYWYRSKKEE